MESESKLNVEVSEQDSISILHFSGIYGPLSITLLKEMVHALIRNKRTRLVFSFDHLGDLDQNAFDFLEWAHDKVSGLGGAIILICPLGEVQDICDELKMRYKFLTFPNFEQAREYFMDKELLAEDT